MFGLRTPDSRLSKKIKKMIRIRDIASYIDATSGGGDREAVVSAAGSVVTNDSRRVVPGGIFVAITGARVDGNLFVNDATKRGANVIISERPRPADIPPESKIVWLKVDNARVALAQAAALVHGHPSRMLQTRRNHRNQRQNDDGSSDRVDLFSRRNEDGDDGHDR